jgi:hypothetical protein
MGNTPSSPASGGSPNVTRHGSLGKHHHSRHSSGAAQGQGQAQAQNTARQASPSALPHHRTTHLHDSFPAPSPRSPLSQRQPVEVSTTNTSSSTSTTTSTAAPTSPITPGNATSPSSLRPGSSPRRRKSLELPDLNRLSLTMATPTVDATAAMNTDQTTPSRSSPLRSNPRPLDSAGGYVPDSVQQGAQGSGQGRRVSMMTGTRAAAGSGDQGQGGKDFVQDNPYFPPVLAMSLGPVAGTGTTSSSRGTAGTPSLPNYSYSPTDSDSGQQMHTEDINAPSHTNSNSSSSATASTTTAGRTMSIQQPRAGVPAPAVVTRDIHDHDPIPVQRGSVSGVSQEGRQRVVREGGDGGDVTPVAFRDPASSGGGEELQMQQQQQPHQADPMPTPTLGSTAPQTMQETTTTTSGLVPTLVTWSGGGKEVYVTGTFAEKGWRTRLKMNKRWGSFRMQGCF